MYSPKVHHWVFLVHFQYHAFEMYFGLDCISLISPQQVLFWSSFLIVILALVYPFYCVDTHQLKCLQDVPTYFVLGSQLQLLNSEIKLLFNPKTFKNANGVSRKNTRITFAASVTVDILILNIIIPMLYYVECVFHYFLKYKNSLHIVSLVTSLK